MVLHGRIWLMRQNSLIRQNRHNVMRQNIHNLLAYPKFNEAVFILTSEAEALLELFAIRWTQWIGRIGQVTSVSAYWYSGFNFSHYELPLPTRYCITYVRSGLYQLVIRVKGFRVCALQWCSRDCNLRDRDLAQISRRDRDRDFVIKAETETSKFETETRDLTFLWW